MALPNENDQRIWSGPLPGTDEVSDAGRSAESVHGADGSPDADDKGLARPAGPDDQGGDAGISEEDQYTWFHEDLLNSSRYYPSDEYSKAVFADSRHPDAGQPNFVGRSEHWSYVDRDYEKTKYF